MYELYMNCKHYIRWLIPVCSECNKPYDCHHCHNEEELHEMDRNKVKLMKCLFCNVYQPKNDKCINPECFKKKHRYYCGKCSLWEHKANRDIYHCDKCGICRVGRKEMFIHCDKCNICWDKRHYNNHPCKINQRNSNCMICLEKSWDSQDSFQILNCGHSYHVKCLQEWFKENYTCPTCKKTAFKPIFMWNAIEAYVNNTRYEDEWMDKWKSNIYCNDCEKKSETKYHPGYHKCQECNSWNTELNEIIKPNK